MTTVFVSGSRTITNLNKEIINRLQNIITQRFIIIVGDANGADKALQKYFSEINYQNVIVFCSSGQCRNNIGNWKIKSVSIAPELKGRDFYTQKDKAMAAEADYGFVLWDGASSGSFNNIIELLKNNKKSLVYFLPKKEFYSISKLADVQMLLSKCDPVARQKNAREIIPISSIRETEKFAQTSLAW